MTMMTMTMMTMTHLVSDKVPRVRQEAGQGELVHTRRVPSILHLVTILSYRKVIIINLGQLRHESVEAGGRGSRVRGLPPLLQHHRHPHHSAWLLLRLKQTNNLKL